MSTMQVITEFGNLWMNFGERLEKMTDHEFYEFCQLNKDWRIERTSGGDVIAMPPTGGKTGIRNFVLTTRFGAWVEADGTGKGFDSSTCFALPNGARRAPDVAWVRNERWEALTDEQQEEFPPLCPDFVIELKSRTDTLEALQAKMREYIKNGAQLGWLIDPASRRVYVYRPQAEVERLDNPTTISGEPLLRGFVLNVEALWM